MDSLCNHKDQATRWADGESPTCTCPTMRPYINIYPAPPEDQHLILDGDTLHFQDKPLTSIVTGSLQNRIFPPQREIFKSLQDAIPTWSKKNSLPSVSCRNIEDLWTSSTHNHNISLHDHITHKDIARFQQLFPDAVFHNEDKRATSLRIIFCPFVYYECLTNTFSDPLVFRKLDATPAAIIDSTIDEITMQFGKIYPWALGSGRDLPNAYVLPKRKKQFRSGRPIVSFFSAPFRPMLNCIAKLIYQLLPKAFPHNLAKGDVFAPSSNSSRPLTLTLYLPHKSTIRILQASSRASTQTDSWTAGASRFNTCHPL